MSKPIVVVGAGRHGRGCTDILECQRLAVAGFLDDTKPKGEIVAGYPVLGGLAAMNDSAFVRDHQWFVAIGDNQARRDLCRTLADAGADFANVVHPLTHVSRLATVGKGIYLGAGATLQTGTVIGDWALFGAQVYVGIDVSVGEAVFLGHGTILSAGTSVGPGAFLGSGVILSNDASVGADCVVGASSLVMRSIPDGTTAYGVPARPAPLKQHPFRR
jgi:sugar O-acyltransferase (sialic acid O-acetyltransferase NeuD family)